jgi:hypothetical protein
MVVISNTRKGRYNTDADEIMKHVRKPVFVDNAVHHARVSIQTSPKAKVIIEKNNSRTLQVMPERTYQLVEGESYIQLTHNEQPGHSSLAAPFFADNVISSTNKPMLIYNADETNQRLLPHTIESASYGIIANLRNMKGKTLSGIGFTNNIVKMGQPIDVGLRTTDLAIRLGESINSGATSVNISRPKNSTASSARKHSTRFVGQDFNNMNLMTALRFLGRHDSRMLLLDRFGNLLYIPITFSEASIFVDKNFRFGGKQDNPIENISNRVTVQGHPLALNDLVIVTVDDVEGQVEEVREDSSPVVDNTARTTNAARRVARQILKSRSLARGSISSEGHMNLLNLRPGMAINYGGEKKVVSEVKHTPMRNMSDITLLNLDTGIEGILQGIAEGTTVGVNETNPATYVQVVEQNLALFGKVELKIVSVVKERGVFNTAYLIGGVKGTHNRGLLGKNGLPIGANKTRQRRNLYAD